MKKGSITIYLSLVLISILLLISIIIESARMNVVHTECKVFTHLASDSVLAGYARQVYEDYGILLVWEEKTLKEQLMEYIQANIDLADLKITGTNIMATKIRDINVRQVQYVADNGGEMFIEQILAYMKYAATTKAVNKLIGLYSKKDNYQEKSDTTEDMINVEENSEISKIVDDINDEVSNLKEGNIKNQLKTKKKRTKFLKKLKKIIKKIESYQKKREDFFKEKKGTYGADYMDFNLKILEQIKNKIEEEELVDSSKTEEKWKNIGEELQKKIQELDVNISTEEDQKNKGIYESAKELLEKGILSMVIDDTSNISSSSIDDSNLPSKKYIKEESLSYGLADKAKIILYAGMKLGNYCNIKNKTDLKYEMEYVIAGKSSDRSNLTDVVEQMTVFRNMATLAYILTDKGKMAEISTIAASAATAIGVPFLEPVIKAVLVESWSLAEAVYDVKVLMHGKKIDIVKNKSNWQTSLRNLNGKKVKGSSKKTAINYQQFGYLLMMKEHVSKIAFRIMDIIQTNIRKNYNQSFCINQCFTGFCIEANYQTKPLFASMPWTVNAFGEKIGDYNFSVKCEKNF